MADHRLERIRSLIRRGEYALSSHVRDKLACNDFSIDDIEYSILRGAITESQHDEQRQAIDSRKYTITGLTEYQIPFETIGKIVNAGEANEFFVITAYELQ